MSPRWTTLCFLLLAFESNLCQALRPKEQKAIDPEIKNDGGVHLFSSSLGALNSPKTPQWMVFSPLIFTICCICLAFGCRDAEATAAARAESGDQERRQITQDNEAFPSSVGASATDKYTGASSVADSGAMEKGVLPNLSVTSQRKLSRSEKPLISLLMLVMLTCYRFNSGFLGSTWLPFLIAKEGEIFSKAHQTVFMGVCKMIYGGSAMLTPVFGLASDRLNKHPTFGRAPFIVVGTIVGGIGVVLARMATLNGSLWQYFSAVTMWMLGEAMADMTADTVVPDFLPPSQYDLASAVRSLHFIAGAMTGNFLLVLTSSWNFEWLYYAYVTVILVCGIVTTTAMIAMRSRSEVEPPDEQNQVTIFNGIFEAYWGPMRYTGGFVGAVVSTFFFSLGMAPMYFTFLEVRDLAMVPDQADQQFHLGFMGNAFLISAAVSSICAGMSMNEGGDEGEKSRWNQVAFATVMTGVSFACMPLVAISSSLQIRLVVMYCISCWQGLAFGAAYARIQAITWDLLPKGANVASALGLLAVCKTLAVGFSNMGAGVILDDCIDPQITGPGQQSHVMVFGYVIMCSLCAFALFISAGLQRKIYYSHHPTPTESPQPS